MVDVEAVVVHWRRPANVARVLTRLRDQTIRPVVTLVDASPDGGLPLPASVAGVADRRVTLHRNTGSWNRYVPMGAYDRPYTWFVDDDLLPGRDAVARLLAAARANPDFGVLGPTGRVVAPDGSYSTRAVVASDDGSSTPADLVVRSYFLRTASLPQVLRVRHMLAERLEPGRGDDDLTACAAVAMMAGRQPLVVPFRLVDEDLPEPDALWHRAEHVEERTRTCRALIEMGWRPLSLRGPPVKR